MDILFTRAQDCSANPVTGYAPEMNFIKPVLKSGSPNKQGAVYRYANIMMNVDAEVTLKKVSRPDIYITDIDLPSQGWDKAFQPEFGLLNTVPAYQDWYIDFQIAFFKQGTTIPYNMPKLDVSALDIDGDGSSLAEYVVFENPDNIVLAAPTSLVSGAVVNNGITGTTIQGPVTNAASIDTGATKFMALFQYVNKNAINFRIGAKTGSRPSYGNGIRLNSVWLRQFSMPQSFMVLPVAFSGFSANLQNKDAVLAWQVAGETISHFVVQRSTDGQSFTTISTISSASANNTYSYTDVAVQAATGEVYYRIGAINKEGKIVYSNIKVLRLLGAAVKATAIETYPNPVTNEVRVTLPAAWQGKAVQIDLCTANGTIARSMVVKNASAMETMETSSLVKGFYFVRASCGAETAQKQIIKN